MRTNGAAAPLHAIATAVGAPSQANNLPNNSMGKKSAEERRKKAFTGRHFYALYYSFDLVGKHFFQKHPVFSGLCCHSLALKRGTCPEDSFSLFFLEHFLWEPTFSVLPLNLGGERRPYTGNHILLLIITKLWGTQVLFCLNVHVLLCLGRGEGIIMLLLYSHTLGSHNFSAPRQKNLIEV